jgi:hypothetical protein
MLFAPKATTFGIKNFQHQVLLDNPSASLRII